MNPKKLAVLIKAAAEANAKLAAAIATASEEPVHLGGPKPSNPVLLLHPWWRSEAEFWGEHGEIAAKDTFEWYTVARLEPRHAHTVGEVYGHELLFWLAIASDDDGNVWVLPWANEEPANWQFIVGTGRGNSAEGGAQ